MYAAALAALALLLIAIAPRVMARQTRFRRAPGAALTAWQAVALAGVVAALAAAPIAVRELVPLATPGRSVLDWAALATSGLVLASLLVNGHLVGTRLRAARRRHRSLVELIGQDATSEDGGPAGYHVVPHETPTAYCIPGGRGRVVLTAGTLESLRDAELRAVLAHERAHLDQRHDLVLELFSVLHRAAPSPIRAPQAMREVKLLIEVLADRAACKSEGEVALARALVALADTPTPVATLGAKDHPSVSSDDERFDNDSSASPSGSSAQRAGRADSSAQRAGQVDSSVQRAGQVDSADSPSRQHQTENPTLARMRLLAQPPAPAWLSGVMYAFSAGVLAAPITLITLALT